CFLFALASLTVYGPKQMITVPTQDSVYQSIPFYKRTGTAVIWPWNTINNSTTRNVKFAASAKSVAIIVYFAPDADRRNYAKVNDMSRAGCATLAQATTDGWIPSITLLVFVALSNMDIPFWGPSTGPYSSAVSTNKEDSSYVDIALIDKNGGDEFFQNIGQEKRFMNFIAVKETGPWNTVYFSLSYIAITIVALLYSTIRSIRLYFVKRRLQGIRLVVFLSSCFISILTLVHILLETPGFSSLLLAVFVEYCVISATGYFWIRTFSVIHMLQTWVFSDGAERLNNTFIILGKTYVPLVSSLACIVYAGIGILVLWATRYSVELYLAAFFLIASLTFIVPSLDNYFIGYKSNILFMITTGAELNVRHIIRILLYFAFIGLHCPYEKPISIKPEFKLATHNVTSGRRIRERPRVIMSLYSEDTSPGLLSQRSALTLPKSPRPDVKQPKKRSTAKAAVSPITIKVEEFDEKSSDSSDLSRESNSLRVPTISTTDSSGSLPHFNSTFSSSKVNMERCTFILDKQDQQGHVLAQLLQTSSSSSSSSSELTPYAVPADSIYVLPAVSFQQSSESLAKKQVCNNNTNTSNNNGSA
ncbi:hypothetical protein BDF22DRAFT_679094, partial [Syncephalis plumigaleata]